MSRSYRRPYIKDGPNPREKRRSARAVRRLPIPTDLDDTSTPVHGKAYRKNFNSWNICDWRWPAPPDLVKKFRRK